MELPTVEHGSPATNGFGSGVLLGVGVAVAVGVGLGVAVAVAVGVGEAEGFGEASVTPLSHTSFLPLFTQVYFFPPAVIVCPALLQALPTFGAVAAWAIEATKTKEISTGNKRLTFLIPKPYLIAIPKTII